MAHHTEDAICPACEEKLALAHPELVKWFREQVKPCHNDVHISWSYRDQASQEQAFLDGKSRLHFPNSKHNKRPALALDLFKLTEENAALFPPLLYAAIASEATAAGSPIEWGGSWVGRLKDLDHFQLDEKQGTVS